MTVAHALRDLTTDLAYPILCGPGTAQCLPPQFNSAGTAVDQLQCYCTTSTCGAGMLDAGAAVRAVAQNVVLGTPVIPVTPTPPVASADTGGGGGALGWPWLLALFGAVAALRSARPLPAAISDTR